MIPSTLSASALNVAELCLARYKAEYVDRARGIGHSAASLGTAVHGALEAFVTETCLKQNTAAQNWAFLEAAFKISYMTTFNTGDASGEIFDDGLNMLTTWYERTSFAEFNVLLCETKENFTVPTSAGPIPFNYIWDRFDQLDETTFRVVDYKTNRWGLRPDDLKKKVQPRMYALAAAIRLKKMGLEANKIWVTFDMLRHDAVGLVFSREQNIEAWNFLNNKVEQIIATPDDEAPETLNPECRFCVRKQVCAALRANIAVGGVVGTTDPAIVVDRRAQIKWQVDGLNAAAAELDQWLLTEGETQDVTEFESDNARVVFSVSARRTVDPKLVERIIGPAKFSEYGGKSISMANYDKLLKDKEITSEQQAQLKGLVSKKIGEPSVRVEAKGSLDED